SEGGTQKEPTTVLLRETSSPMRSAHASALKHIVSRHHGAFLQIHNLEKGSLYETEHHTSHRETSYGKPSALDKPPSVQSLQKRERLTPKRRRGPQGTDSRLPHHVRCGPSPPALCSVRHTHDTPLPGPPPALRSTSVQRRDHSLTDR